MNEWPDDKLDKLFRKSAEELDPEYDPDDWTKLKNRLDANDNPGGVWWKRNWPWMLGLLLLITGGGVASYLMLAPDSSRNVAAETREEIIAGQTAPVAGGRNEPAAVSKKSTEKQVPGTLPGSTNGESAGQPTPTVKNAVVKTTATGPIESRPHKAASHSGQPKKLPRHHLHASGVRIKPERWGTEGGDGVSFKNRNYITSSLDQVRSGAPAVPENVADPKVNPEDQPAGIIAGSGSENPGQARLALLSPSDLSLDGWPVEFPPVVYQVPDSSGKETPPRAAPVPRLSVRLGIAPDLSTVGLRNFSKPGTAWTALLEYRLAKRWAVQAGVARSFKTYQAQAGGYSWPYSWKQQVLPSSVDGDCKILEIPVNIRYRLTTSDRSGWVVSTGVSSYKMLNERYRYNYEVNDPSIRWWKWEGETGWYWLSHLNFSVAYERKLSKRLTLTAEPYFRAPLKKVGFGKVNLFTSGVWLSARYQLPFF